MRGRFGGEKTKTNVVADGELEVARDDAALLVVSGGVASELEAVRARDQRTASASKVTSGTDISAARYSRTAAR